MFPFTITLHAVQQHHVGVAIYMDVSPFTISKPLWLYELHARSMLNTIGFTNHCQKIWWVANTESYCISSTFDATERQDLYSSVAIGYTCMLNTAAYHVSVQADPLHTCSLCYLSVKVICFERVHSKPGFGDSVGTTFRSSG